MRTPRTAFQITALNIGGSERLVCVLAREFANRGWDTHTWIPGADNHTELLRWCQAQGVPVEAQPAVLEADQPHSIGKVRELARFVRSNRIELVNVHYGDNFISLKDVLGIRLGGARCVAQVNHPTPWNNHNSQKRTMTRLGAMLCKRVVTICEATRQVLLEAGIPARKIVIVPCGVKPPASFRSRADARRELGIAKDAFVIGSIGRHTPYKGFRELIEATALVPDPENKMLLLIGGDGDDRPYLEEMAAKQLGNRARFVGRLPDANDLYAASDIFAMPSHMEGFGLVYVEAAFHGIPSIGTDVGGVRKAIVDGETGLLVPVGDIPALVKVIARLREDIPLRERMGAAARERAYAGFTESVIVEKYEQVLMG